jgi:DNA-binding NarL/FixJ family response regulator
VIRIVIVDDQALVRAGLTRIFDPADGFEVVAAFADGAELVDALPALAVDLVLTDIRMPRMNGIDAARAVRARPDPPPVLVLTTFDDDDVLWGAIDAGAAGFVLKDASGADLLAAARAVAGGGAWFDPAVAPRVLAAYRRTAWSRRDAGRLDALTDRERDVLARMARGATNAEIAVSLHVSEATVKTHVRGIFTKLGARDRAAAIVLAFDCGAVPPTG